MTYTVLSILVICLVGYFGFQLKSTAEFKEEASKHTAQIAKIEENLVAVAEENTEVTQELQKIEKTKEEIVTKHTIVEKEKLAIEKEREKLEKELLNLAK